MYVVGLTGGIGCGKSTVEKHFRNLGVPIVDADLITHELQKPGQAGYVFIKEMFGNSVIDFDGSLNRIALRNIVFNDKAQKEKLEGLMTPLVYHVINERLNTLGLQGVGEPHYIILTVPLLLESKTFSQLADRVAVVDCPEHIQIDRVMKRSNMTYKEVEKILDAQAPRYFRLMKGDDIILNYDCDPEDHKKTVLELHDFYNARALEKMQKHKW